MRRHYWQIKSKINNPSIMHTKIRVHRQFEPRKKTSQPSSKSCTEVILPQSSLFQSESIKVQTRDGFSLFASLILKLSELKASQGFIVSPKQTTSDLHTEFQNPPHKPRNVSGLLNACASSSFLTPKLGLEQHVWLCTAIHILCRFFSV